MRTTLTLLALTALAVSAVAADPKPAKRKKSAEPEVVFPPALPDGKAILTVTTDDFLKPPATLKPGVAVAKAAPTVDFLYYPGQTYAGKPWSNWGDSTAVAGKYYSSVGDHLAPAGNAAVFEYDAAAKTLRQLTDLKGVLKLPEGHYAPGKIHSRVDLGSDGRLYYSTHRGSTSVTTDQYHYKGDWVLAHDLKTGRTEIVAHAPVAKHCIPTGVLDSDRLIFYGGTAPGVGGDGEGVRFFAWDVKASKMLFECADGPARALILSRSTGRVYWNPGKDDAAGLVRFDPAAPGPPQKIDAVIGLRAATAETPDGMVYTVSQGGKGGEPKLFAFDVRTEKVRELGPAAVGTQGYITTLDADPTGRFLYYIPGAHGGSDADGAAVVQFDVKTGRRKVIAFLHPAFRDRIGATLRGTYGAALDPAGDKLYITWNVSRGTKAWDCCALTVLHIPESERRP